VGGHCIPVYPHFLLDRAPELGLVALAREVNDGQVDRAIEVLAVALEGLRDSDVLVLGLTYRDGVKELAYSRALPLIERLLTAGARVHAFDPLLSADEIARTGATPWSWAEPTPGVRAIVTQTADPLWSTLDPSWFADLVLVLDGRNTLRDLPLPPGVGYHGIGVPAHR
jgi:UDP-N-acetyl-D-mannosaminuronate dehydrogenase